MFDRHISQKNLNISAPSSPPDSVHAELVSRDGKIVVRWNPLPDSKSNGILQGYVVYYTIIRIGTEEVAEEVKSVTTSKYAARVVLTGFQPYTQVKIEVAAFTMAGEGPKSQSVFVGRPFKFHSLFCCTKHLGVCRTVCLIGISLKKI